MLNEKWLKQLDSKIRQEGVAPGRRAVEALSRYSKYYRQRQDNADTASAILHWFQKH